MGTLTLEASYIIDPSLNDNPVFLVAVVIFVTWVAAGFALRGLKVARGFAWYSVVIGTVFPVAIMVGFAIASLASGTPSAMDLSPGAFFSGFDVSNIAFLSGALLMFSGIEISAIHAADIQHPARTIPRANLIAVGMCFLLLAPLTMAIGVITPAGDIDIVTGVLQAAESVLNQFGVGWLLPVFGFCIVTGLAAGLVQIINGPSRGLVVAGRQGGNLPPFLQKENGNRMPVVIILTQAAISSVLSLGYLFLGSVQNAWFMFALIQTNMTLILYLIMFASVIKLRYSRPDANRPYQIPGKKVGLWAITGIGMLVCLLGILVSFQPTEEASGMSTPVYIAILLFGTAAFVAMPFVFWLFRKPSWKTEQVTDPDQPDPEALDAPVHG
jgi:amino acid transporter